MVQRREGREIVIKALFAEELGGNDPDYILNSVIKPKFKDDESNYPFTKKLFYRTLENKEQLDGIIQAHIKNWRLDRLASLDKIILRMALCEFLYFEEIPIKVTINEAIEIAKDYSTTKSGKFINGILDAALDDLQEKGKINKKGRGLIESSINS